MICPQCNKEFTKTHHNQKYCSKICSKKTTKENIKKFHQSDKGKEAVKKFRQSDKGKKGDKKYVQSEKGQATRKKYEQSDLGKKTIKRNSQSDLGKARTKRYQQSDKGKKSKRKYAQSEKGKENYKHYSQLAEVKKSRREYFKERRISDPLFKLTMAMRNRLNGFLKSTNINKTNKTFQEVGCTPEFLKKYLEKQFKPGMTWKNHTKDGWHIDHRISLDTAKSREDLERLGVAHYTNLQPMWATENIKKGNKVL